MTIQVTAQSFEATVNQRIVALVFRANDRAPAEGGV